MAAATDDFNRADNTSLGANWTTVSTGGFDATGFQIVSNAAQPEQLTGDDLELYTGSTFADDQYAQAKVTVTSTGSNAGLGVVVRGATNGSCYRAVVSKAASNNVSLFKFVAGAGTNLGNRTTTWVDGDTLRIEVQGTTITLYQNGVALGATFSDSALASGAPGISHSTSITSGSLDDFAAGDLNAVAPGLRVVTSPLRW